MHQQRYATVGPEFAGYESSCCTTPPSTNLPTAQKAPIGSNTSLSNGLVSYWKLDDSSGSAAADSMGTILGSGFTGTWTSGKIGGAGNFNGAGNAIFMATTPANSYPLSIAAWVKPTGALGVIAAILSNGNTRWYGHFIAFGSNAFTMNCADNNAFSAASGSAVAGSWHHVVGVVASATSRTVFIDGVAAGSDTGNCTPSITPNRITLGGATHSITDNYFSGLIDEVGVWNRALSASEVAALYHGGSGNPFGNCARRSMATRVSG